MFKNIEELLKHINKNEKAVCSEGAFVGCSLFYSTEKQDFVLCDSLGNETEVSIMGRDIKLKSLWTI